jgi:hypothetical protein
MRTQYISMVLPALISKQPVEGEGLMPQKQRQLDRTLGEEKAILAASTSLRSESAIAM